MKIKNEMETEVGDSSRIGYLERRERERIERGYGGVPVRSVFKKVTKNLIG
jgi:hypothetical protein